MGLATVYGVVKQNGAHNSIMNLASRVGLADSELFSITEGLRALRKRLQPSRRDRVVNYCAVDQD